MANKNLTNIQVYRKKWHFNIGLVLFGVIFIYLIVTILLYLTRSHVSVYEVREGSILKDTAYTGFILRDESVVYSDRDGYINYFALEGSKVGVKTRVCSISDDELQFHDETPDQQSEALTSEEQASIQLKTKTFSESFNENRFGDVYTLKDNISTLLDSKSNQSRQAQLDAMIVEGVQNLQIFQAFTDGIISYSCDGYEGVSFSDVTEDMIRKTDYKKTAFYNNMKVKSGDPIYKLIRSDSWTVVILLDDDTAQELADTSSVKVKFSKDGETARAGFQIYNTEDANMGFLSFDTSMIRYVEDRYIDLELILEDESGLKIPKSSVISKEFYTVPQDYLTQGGNTNATGVLIDNGSDTPEFQQVDVYYRNSENDMVYLSTDDFEAESILRKEDSGDTYELSETEKLKGVYNINKGYAVFKPVTVLCESDEYYIVEEGNSYGLSNYDHIALYGDSIHENDVII